jgi:hypothetical protein
VFRPGNVGGGDGTSGRCFSIVVMKVVVLKVMVMIVS